MLLTIRTASADANATVTLNVVGLLPGAKPEAQTALAEEVADFQKENPNITVKTNDYEWKATTFAADLAGGTLPTVFEIPFTDAKTLIANGQIADMQSSLGSLSYAGNFNKNLLQYGQGPDGHVYAIPAKSIYAVGLHYNRDLFTQAGLDPSKPPTTWDEVRTAAKAIASKTGVAGFAQMAKDATGGWQLTVDTYARGGRIESDGKKATLNNDATKAALQFLKDLRWTDNSMGANFDYDWAQHQPGLRRRQDRHVHLGSGRLHEPGADEQHRPEVVRPHDDPALGQLTPACSAAAPWRLSSSKATANEKAAAIKWIDYHYLRKYTNQDAAAKNAQIQVASKQPVGTPELPIFSQAAVPAVPGLDQVRTSTCRWTR